MSINVSFVTTELSSSYYPTATSGLFNSVIVDGVPYNVPYSTTWTIGSQHTVSANNLVQDLVGRLYNWNSWSGSPLLISPVAQTISAPASDTQFTANYVISPQLYSEIDPLVFMQTQYSGSILDSTNNNAAVRFTTQNPDAVNGLPVVTVNAGNINIEWLTVGVRRTRYFQDLDMTIWALSPAQRFAIDMAIRHQTTIINKNLYPTMPPNYVFMWHPFESYTDEVTLFGTAVYRTVLSVRVIYDLLRPT